MKATIRGRGSTLRFAAGIIAAVVIITDLTLALITADLCRGHPDDALGSVNNPGYQLAINPVIIRRMMGDANPVSGFVDGEDGDIRARLRPQVTALIARNRAVLDLVREETPASVTSRPACRRSVGAPSPSAVGRQGCAYQLLACAVIRMGRGDTDTAVADL